MAKSSRNRLVVVALCAAFAACALVGCGGSSGAVEGDASGSTAALQQAATSASEPSDVRILASEDIPNDSILYFKESEGSARIIDDMDSGRIPKRCNVVFDAGEELPAVDVTDRDALISLYNAFARVTVSLDGAQSINGASRAPHHVVFYLQDSTMVRYNFEEAELLRWGHYAYAAHNTDELWELVRRYQVEFDEHEDEAEAEVSESSASVASAASDEAAAEEPDADDEALAIEDDEATADEDVADRADEADGTDGAVADEADEPESEPGEE